MEDAENVANVPDEYNVANSTMNLSNSLGDVNVDKEVEDQKREALGGDLKLPTYRKVLNMMGKTSKKTIPILTKYERARILGVRKQQLASGAKPCIDVRGMKSIDEIAEAELEKRLLPFIVKRPLPNGTSEYWKLEEFLSVS